MLALVKMPHTEIILNGEGANDIIKLLKTKFQVEVFSPEEDELIDINKTQWWKNNGHRVLAGARLKANLTQEELAKKVGIRQSVLCEYEKGKRRITQKTATKLGEVLNVNPEKLIS